MVGGDKEEFEPLLPVGFHSLDTDRRWRLCVEEFPTSDTRAVIMANLERLIATINSQGIVGNIWIDGSFMTKKLNPDDVDIALILSRSEFESLSTKQRLFFEHFRDTSFYDHLRIDNYGVVIDETDLGQWIYSYWLRQFGFSRKDEMKGILKVPVPLVVQ